MKDLIDRQAAIKAFKPEHRCDWYTPQIIDVLNNLPSVQIDMPVVDTEDLIVRGDAMEAVNKRIKQIGYENDPYVLSIRQAVAEVPSAQPKPPTDDCISRKAAITLPVMPKEHREYQTINLDDAYEQGWNDLQKCIESLPSAQPEPLDEWCTDCKEYDHERHCCPRWNRVIRQTLKDMKEEHPEIIRCKDCKFYRCDGCFFSTAETEENGFCYWAERRTDEAR